MFNVNIFQQDMNFWIYQVKNGNEKCLALRELEVSLPTWVDSPYLLVCLCLHIAIWLVIITHYYKCIYMHLSNDKTLKISTKFEKHTFNLLLILPLRIAYFNAHLNN